MEGTCGIRRQPFIDNRADTQATPSLGLQRCKSHRRSPGLPPGHQSRANTHERMRVAAKRISKEEAAAGEWAAILSLENEEEPPAEGITVEDLNKICNKGLKLMLNEDTNGLLDFQGELNVLGRTFTDNQDKDGALFIYVLWKMCDHVVVDQTTSLSGMYLEAFRRVFDILEDSGWQLVREGEEEEMKQGLDDLPNLPYMQQL